MNITITMRALVPLYVRGLCLLFFLLMGMGGLAAQTGAIGAVGGAEQVQAHEIPRGDFTIRAGLPISNDIVPLLRSKLSAREVATFLKNGELIYRHGESFVPELLIGNEEVLQRVSTEHQEKQNNIALEILMALELPATIKNSLNDNELELHIFNILHRISTLSGLEYFSASRGHLRTFYIDSSIVQEADGVSRRPDPVFSRLRESYRFVMRQEDASFGDNLYEVFTSPGAMSIRNISPMFYSIILVANPSDLELQLRVHRAGNYLLFYALSSMKAPDIFGIQEKVRNSFYNRMVALYNWFADELPHIKR